MNKILIIDDDRELCALIKRSVQAENIEADFCNTGKEGLQKLREQEYQLVVLDVMMPGMDGFETLEEIRKGEVNRQIAADNKLLKEIKARITRLYRWSKAETEKPQTQQSSLTALWEAQQQLNAPRTRTGKIRALQESAALFSFLQANGIQSMLCWCRTSLWKMTSSWRSGAAWDTPYCCALRCSKPAASQNQSFRRIKTEGGFHIGLCTRTQRFNQSQNQGYVQSDPKAAGLLYRRGACRRTAVLFAP